MEYYTSMYYDDGVRYVIEGGEVKKMYLFFKGDSGLYLTRASVLNPNNPPKFYTYGEIFSTRKEAESSLI